MTTTTAATTATTAWKPKSIHSQPDRPWFVERLLEIVEETNKFIQEYLDGDTVLVGSEMRAGPNFKCVKAQLMEDGKAVGPMVKMTMFTKNQDRRGKDVQMIGLEINGNEHYISADPFILSAIINQYADIEESSTEVEGAEIIGG